LKNILFAKETMTFMGMLGQENLPETKESPLNHVKIQGGLFHA